MKKTETYFILGVLWITIGSLNLSCSENLGEPEPPKLVVDLDDLEIMYKQIVGLSESSPCISAGEWSFTAIGDKPCGGAAGYIAYSSQIDTMAFLASVETYNVAHRKYNVDNGIVSDCSVVQKPEGVRCHDEKPVLVYDRCELHPDAGSCEAAIPKYYFDQITKKCNEFLWGGCDGVVPFDTLEECLECESGG